MKLLVMILSLYVLLLSGIPCNAFGHCCSDEIESSSNSQEPLKHKPEFPCSPFFACGSCHAIIVPQITYEVTAPIIFDKERHFYHSEGSVVQYSYSIFQPPKVG